VADIRREFPRFEARICVDSAPVLEKYWAVNSGLGWQGKNSNIIHPRMGSFFFYCRNC
jgi:epoxyqueuosine reductase